VISDRDVWIATLLFVKRYCDDAMLEAAERAINSSTRAHGRRAETWHHITSASRAGARQLLD
jgi:hypothetical protein